MSTERLLLLRQNIVRMMTKSCQFFQSDLPQQVRCSPRGAQLPNRCAQLEHGAVACAFTTSGWFRSFFSRNESVWNGNRRMYLVQGEKMRCVGSCQRTARGSAFSVWRSSGSGLVKRRFYHLLNQIPNIRHQRCPPRQVRLCKRKFAEEKETTCEGKMFL